MTETTYTTNLALTKPHTGKLNWGDDLNTNFDTLDTAVGTGRGIADGIASLDSEGKISVNQLITDIALGIPTLDENGILNPAQLPPLAITETFTADTEIAMLALETDIGDVVIRTDENKTYIRYQVVAEDMTDFKQIIANDLVITHTNNTTFASGTGGIHGLRITNGTIEYNGGAGWTTHSHNASAITAGTIAPARLPITVSTEEPTGGVAGDIWMIYEV
ncbi:hypothetical protein [Bacteroides sp.]|uniref:hypothetical protein n=1 Tax=Bacteroides sp. TaxID=29523 RepID=UPI002629E10A|nr:hypothetical protein [Bacteroides sp.]MDD3038997.1 hypothetical protein [Bacteroides sp.]